MARLWPRFCLSSPSIASSFLIWQASQPCCVRTGLISSSFRRSGLLPSFLAWPRPPATLSTSPPVTPPARPWRCSLGSQGSG
jgi:hypothetical protein